MPNCLREAGVGGSNPLTPTNNSLRLFHSIVPAKFRQGFATLSNRPAWQDLSLWSTAWGRQWAQNRQLIRRDRGIRAMPRPSTKPGELHSQTRRRVILHQNSYDRFRLQSDIRDYRGLNAAYRRGARRRDIRFDLSACCKRVSANFSQAVVYTSPPHLASHLHRGIMYQCRWGGFLSAFLQLIRIRFIALSYSFLRAEECMF